jgi:hypothetical protein
MATMNMVLSLQKWYCLPYNMKIILNKKIATGELIACKIQFDALADLIPAVFFVTLLSFFMPYFLRTSTFFSTS